MEKNAGILKTARRLQIIRARLDIAPREAGGALRMAREHFRSIERGWCQITPEELERIALLYELPVEVITDHTLPLPAQVERSPSHSLVARIGQMLRRAEHTGHYSMLCALTASSMRICHTLENPELLELSVTSDNLNERLAIYVPLPVFRGWDMGILEAVLRGLFHKMKPFRSKTLKLKVKRRETAIRKPLILSATSQTGAEWNTSTNCSSLSYPAGKRLCCWIV